MNHEKIIFLIGPARSGTKILRDVISTHPYIDKVPFDINFIWKYGHSDSNSDLLKPNDFNRFSQNYIEKYINRLRSKNGYIIEKSVSNSVRIPYVLQNFPESKFIFLVRDGLDTVESVSRQWFKNPDKRYLFDKAKTIPLKILLSYGIKYIFNRGKRKDEYIWGVNVPGIEDYDSVEEKAAYQWSYCIESMMDSYNKINEDQKIIVQYEEMVYHPQNVLTEVLKFIDKNYNLESIDLNLLNSRNVGKSKEHLDEVQTKSINEIIKKTQYNLDAFIREKVENK